MIRSVDQDSARVLTITDRDAARRLTGARTSEAVCVRREFDLLGRVTDQAIRDGSGLDHSAWAWDWRGRLTGSERAVGGRLKERRSNSYSTEGWLERETRERPNTGRTPGTTSTTAQCSTESLSGVSLLATVFALVVSTLNAPAVPRGPFADPVPADHPGPPARRAAAGGSRESGERTEVAIGHRAALGPVAVAKRARWVGAAVAWDLIRAPDGSPVVFDNGLASRAIAWGNPEADLPLVTVEDSGEAHLVLAVEGLQLGRVSSVSGFTTAISDPQGTLAWDGGSALDAPSAFGEGAADNVASGLVHVYAGLASLPGVPFQVSRSRMYDPRGGACAQPNRIHWTIRRTEGCGFEGDSAGSRTTLLGGVGRPGMETRLECPRGCPSAERASRTPRRGPIRRWLAATSRSREPKRSRTRSSPA